MLIFGGKYSSIFYLFRVHELMNFKQKKYPMSCSLFAKCRFIELLRYMNKITSKDETPLPQFLISFLHSLSHSLTFSIVCEADVMLKKISQCIANLFVRGRDGYKIVNNRRVFIATRFQDFISFMRATLIAF